MREANALVYAVRAQPEGPPGGRIAVVRVVPPSARSGPVAAVQVGTRPSLGPAGRQADRARVKVVALELLHGLFLRFRLGGGWAPGRL